MLRVADRAARPVLSLAAILFCSPLTAFSCEVKSVFVKITRDSGVHFLKRIPEAVHLLP